MNICHGFIKLKPPALQSRCRRLRCEITQKLYEVTVLLSVNLLLTKEGTDAGRNCAQCVEFQKRARIYSFSADFLTLSERSNSADFNCSCSFWLNDAGLPFTIVPLSLW